MNLLQRRSVYHGRQRPICGPWAINKDAPSYRGLVAFVPLGLYSGFEYDVIGGDILSGTAPAWTAPKDADGVDETFGPHKVFTAASSQYYERSTAPVTDVPLTIAAWAMSTTVADSQACVAIGDNTGSARSVLVFGGVTAGDPIQANSVTSGGLSSSANTTTGYTANTWQHACAVFAAANDRRAFRNGTAKGTETTSRAMSGLNSMNIGTRYSGGLRGVFFSGAISHVCVWNRALSDEEVDRIVDRHHRWELYYRLGVKTFSFPVPAGFNAAFSSAIHQRHPMPMRRESKVAAY